MIPKHVSPNSAAPPPHFVSDSKVSLNELGQYITDGTIFLTCWMTSAQIEKLRTQKVMFKDLQ